MEIRSVRDRLSEKLRVEFSIGLLSVVWFLLRTGTKPSRVVYPCQRAAAANIYMWLTSSVLPFLFGITQRLTKTDFSKKRIIAVVAMVVVVAGSLALLELHETRREELKEEEVAGLTLEGRLAEVQPASDIFVVTGTNGHDDGLRKLINLMGQHDLFFYKSNTTGKNSGPNGLIAKDDVIIIKVNSQWDQRGGTNTDLLKSIIEAILDHPDGFIGEIVVADNGQAQYGAHGSGGSLDWRYNNAENRSQSVQRVVDAFSDFGKVSTYLWDTITLKKVHEYFEGDMDDGYIVNQTANSVTGIRVSYPKFKTKFGTYISFKLGIWNPERKSYNTEKLKVINVPVLKAHFIYGVTACVKHYMGVVSDRLTGHNAHQSVGRGGMGTEMVETRIPILNILDAIWVNAHPGEGPGTSYLKATRVNITMASTDPVALDYWAAKYVLMQTAELLGHTDLSSIDPDNTAQGSFGTWLRLSMQEMVKEGYQATVDEDQMNVYVVNLQSKS
ncbi:MAG: DUF362 domain-containing protein [Candidatus Bathyarchaeia archaeon]